MLQVLGRGRQLCDGITRRQLMQVGAISSLGLSLPAQLQAAAENAPEGSAKSVILVNLLGGPSHIDMFDMKPEAPTGIRGEFSPIDTSLSGLQICEHLPMTARTMHHSTLIRTHSHLYNTHSPYNLLTGYSGPVLINNVAKPDDQPCIGSVMQHAGLRSEGVPSFVWMPSHPGHSQSKRRAGPYGGFLGKTYDPLFTSYSPTFETTVGRSAYANPAVPIADPHLPALDRPSEITLNRLDRRRSLLNQIDEKRAGVDGSLREANLGQFQQTAIDLLTSTKTRDAFNLSNETPETRERYGRNLFGSCMLTARRLVEAGTKFVGVTTESQFEGKVGAGQWDTHSNNFKLLKNFNLPTLDRNYSALIEDLADRGLLDSTLVVLMGEMGRTPKVKPQNGGRDHWTQCGFIVLTGGGVKRGCVYGRSDRQGAWPLDFPVSSADHVATIYQLLGIDPHMIVHDRNGRPISISLEGRPVHDVIA